MNERADELAREASCGQGRRDRHVSPMRLRRRRG